MKRVHIIGVGGIGMSGLARLCLEKGLPVSGSDLRYSDAIKVLEGMGVHFFEGHQAASIDDTVECVVYTSAAHYDNPELVEARKRQIPCIARAEFLSHFITEKTNFIVAGSHGKTTTTSMLAEICRAVEGNAASFYIGGVLRSTGVNAHRGTGRLMAVELDESDGSFLLFKNGTAVVTTIDYEHVDYYTSEDDYLQAFADFINAQNDAVIIGSEAYERIKTRITKEVIVAGLDRGKCPDSYTAHSFTIDSREVQLAVSGMHNVFDAWCAYCAARQTGIAHEQCAGGLQNFSGTKRRMEELYNDGSIILVDDYGHHPTEVAVTYAAIREKYSGYRIIVLLQPHRYTRFNRFYSEFFEAARTVGDNLIILPVYAAAEKEPGEHSGKSFAEALQKVRDNVAYADSLQTAYSLIREKVQKPCVVVSFGAGDGNSVLFRLAEDYKGGKTV